jgi:hypothetical protein
MPRKLKTPQGRKRVGRETLAYVAGLFDGEGCVNFTQAGAQRTWVIRVMIRNTDRKVIDYLQVLFGGRIETKALHRDNPTWKASYCWRLDWDMAINFLVAIEPWVRIKREQILVARFWDALRNRNKKRPTNEEKQTVADQRQMVAILVRQLSWLNRKGRRKENDKEPMQEILDTLEVPIDQILAEAGIAADTLQ